ncbi:MAG: hypothetical protein HZB62_10980 [Nitrospirae bacterium]|nr:hypothetical protein [Nitrospirota bacterium]
MQMDKAQKIRKAWGNKPCPHPTFDKEYCLGSDTGDYICIQCGRSFTKEEKNQIEASKK